MQITRWIPIALICLSFSGCASFTGGDKTKSKSKKDSSWFSWKKKEYQVPHSMAVIWSEDVLTTPGKPPTRGFGGRIYFYNEKSQAIPVEGELLVYGYDESAPKPSNLAAPAADKRFRFTAEQFTEHFSESELGASYSIWIPWDAAGGFSKKITLIPTFTTADGRLVRGDASKVTLAGRSPTGQPDYGQSTVQQVSHVEPTNNGVLHGGGLMPAAAGGLSTADQSMRTTTIQLPSATSRRLSTPTVNDSSNNTSVRYGNGMTQEQLQAALANGTLGGGLSNALTNLNSANGLSQSQFPGQVGNVPVSNYAPNNFQPQYGQQFPNQMMGQQLMQGQQPMVVQPIGTQPTNAQQGFGMKTMPTQTAPNAGTPAAINGFATPGLPQQDWSALSANSLWSQLPAQGITTAPTASSRAH